MRCASAHAHLALALARLCSDGGAPALASWTVGSLFSVVGRGLVLGANAPTRLAFAAGLDLPRLAPDEVAHAYETFWSLALTRIRQALITPA